MLGKIVSPRLEKLERDFLESGGEWKEVRIGNIFEKQDLKFLKDKFDKNNDISKERTEEFSLPLVNAKNGDNGVMYYGREKDFDSVEMSIDIVNDGAVSTGNVYAQPQKTGVLYNAYLIKLKNYSANSKILLYFASVIEKSIKMKFGYDNKAGWEKVKKESIQLPTQNGKIDFEFMESFVAELEAQRVAELEDYLTVTGLKDYELTEKEKNILLMFENLELKEYEIGDFFEIRPTKAYRYTNSDLFDKSGKYPVVTNSSNSNGITGYTNLTPTENGNIITYSDTTTSEGIFYQPRNFVGYSHIQGLYPFKFKDKWNCYTLLYIVSTFRKSAAGRFDYGNKFNRKFAKKLKISLPVKNYGIDFEFMETLIRAVQKLVIKDVVGWADKKIEATKQVAGRN